MMNINNNDDDDNKIKPMQHFGASTFLIYPSINRIQRVLNIPTSLPFFEFLKRQDIKNTKYFISYPFNNQHISLDFNKKQFFLLRIKKDNRYHLGVENFIQNFSIFKKDHDEEKVEKFFKNEKDFIEIYDEQITKFNLSKNPVGADKVNQRKRFIKICKTDNPNTSPRYSFSDFFNLPLGFYIMITDLGTFLEVIGKRLDVYKIKYKKNDYIKELDVDYELISKNTTGLEIKNFNDGRGFNYTIINFYKIHQDSNNFFIIKIPFLFLLLTKLIFFEKGLGSKVFVIPRNDMNNYKILKKFKKIQGNPSNHIFNYDYLKYESRWFNRFNNINYFDVISNRFDIIISLSDESNFHKFLNIYSEEMRNIRLSSNVSYSIIIKYSFDNKNEFEKKIKFFKKQEWKWIKDSLYTKSLKYLPINYDMEIIGGLPLFYYLNLGGGSYIDKQKKSYDKKGKMIMKFKKFPTDLEISMFDNTTFHNASIDDDDYLKWLNRGVSLRRNILQEKKIYEKRESTLRNCVINWLEYYFGILTVQNKHIVEVFIAKEKKKKFVNFWKNKINVFEKFMLIYQLFLTDRYVKLLKVIKYQLFPFLKIIDKKASKGELFKDISPNITEEEKEIIVLTQFDETKEREMDLSLELEFYREYTKFISSINQSFNSFKSYINNKNMGAYYHSLLLNIFNKKNKLYNFIRDITRLLGFLNIDNQNKYLYNVLKEVEDAQSQLYYLKPDVLEKLKQIDNVSNIKMKWSRFYNFLRNQMVDKLKKMISKDISRLKKAMHFFNIIDNLKVLNIRNNRELMNLLGSKLKSDIFSSIVPNLQINRQINQRIKDELKKIIDYVEIQFLDVHSVQKIIQSFDSKYHINEYNQIKSNFEEKNYELLKKTFVGLIDNLSNIVFVNKKGDSSRRIKGSIYFESEIIIIGTFYNIFSKKYYFDSDRIDTPIEILRSFDKDDIDLFKYDFVNEVYDLMGDYFNFKYKSEVYDKKLRPFILVIQSYIFILLTDDKMLSLFFGVNSIGQKASNFENFFNSFVKYFINIIYNRVELQHLKSGTDEIEEHEISENIKNLFDGFIIRKVYIDNYKTKQGKTLTIDIENNLSEFYNSQNSSLGLSLEMLIIKFLSKVARKYDIQNTLIKWDFINWIKSLKKLGGEIGKIITSGKYDDFYLLTDISKIKHFHYNLNEDIEKIKMSIYIQNKYVKTQSIQKGLTEYIQKSIIQKKKIERIGESLVNKLLFLLDKNLFTILDNIEFYQNMGKLFNSYKKLESDFKQILTFIDNVISKKVVPADPSGTLNLLRNTKNILTKKDKWGYDFVNMIEFIYNIFNIGTNVKNLYDSFNTVPPITPENLKKYLDAFNENTRIFLNYYSKPGRKENLTNNFPNFVSKFQNIYHILISTLNLEINALLIEINNHDKIKFALSILTGFETLKNGNQSFVNFTRNGKTYRDLDEYYRDVDNYSVKLYYIVPDEEIIRTINIFKDSILSTKSLKDESDIEKKMDLDILNDDMEFKNKFYRISLLVNDIKEMLNTSFEESTVYFDEQILDLVNFFKNYEFDDGRANKTAIKLRLVLSKLLETIYYGQCKIDASRQSSLQTSLNFMESKIFLLYNLYKKQDSFYLLDFSSSNDLVKKYESEKIKIENLKRKNKIYGFLYKKEEKSFENAILNIYPSDNYPSKLISNLKILKNNKTEEYMLLFYILFNIYKILKNYDNYIKNKGICNLDHYTEKIIRYDVQGNEITDEENEIKYFEREEIKMPYISVHYEREWVNKDTNISIVNYSNLSHWIIFFLDHKDDIILKHKNFIGMKFLNDQVKKYLRDKYFNWKRATLNPLTFKEYNEINDKDNLIREVKNFGLYALGYMKF